ncbi:MAG: type II toxin-antitoxin system VapC family toxin, partial [Caulobacteraceae bacterium]
MMLDTCVYLDVMHGQAPATVEKMLRDRIVNHSAVCVAELAHTLGRLDPAHAATRAALQPLERAIAAIPNRRLSVPSERAFGESGMLAGLVMRLAGEGSP